MNPQTSRGASSIQLHRVFWAALFVGQLMILGMSVLQQPFQLESIGEAFQRSSTVYVFVFLGLMNFLLACFLPKMMIASALKRGFRLADEAALLRFVFVPLVFRLAFAESIVLMGFTALAETKNSATILPFVALSWTVFFLNFPSRRLFRSWLPRY